MIVYDIEIKRGIRPKKKTDIIQGIQYCDSWTDYKMMGISLICTYDYSTGKEESFSDEISIGTNKDQVNGNFNDFQKLLDKTDFIVGYNNIGFDDLVCNALGITIKPEKSYDILRAIWYSSGLSNKFNRLTHAGLGLDAVAKSNDLAEGKSGDGEFAPMWFQRKEYEKLISYCKQDVLLTKKLLDRILISGKLIHPRSNKVLKIETPYDEFESKFKRY